MDQEEKRNVYGETGREHQNKERRKREIQGINPSTGLVGTRGESPLGTCVKKRVSGGVLKGKASTPFSKRRKEPRAERGNPRCLLSGLWRRRGGNLTENIIGRGGKYLYQQEPNENLTW